jgi:hypothetical protein
MKAQNHLQYTTTNVFIVKQHLCVCKSLGYHSFSGMMHKKNFFLIQIPKITLILISIKTSDVAESLQSAVTPI